MNEADMIDDLRTQGYILKKEKGNVKAVHTAYRAGVYAGRAEVIVEMLDSLRKDKELGGNIGILLESEDIDITKYLSEFISWYLPKRYKEAQKLIDMSTGVKQ